MNRLHVILVWMFFLGTALPAAAPEAESVAAAPEVISLLGEPYYAAPAEGEALAGLQQDLAAAEAVFADGEPTAAEYIMLGRRLAYLWRYHEAIAVYSRGIEKFPDEAMLYRHRGHRYISIRKFRLAAADLAKAATLDSHDFDIWYHLGLAHYLQGDYVRAWEAYQHCRRTVTDDDSLVAVSYWMTLTGFRLSRLDEINTTLADIQPGMKVEENEAYYRLLRMFKGELTAEEVRAWAADSALNTNTCGYGIAAWTHYNWQIEESRRMLGELISDHRYWPAFGFIAAETDLARLQPEEIALHRATDSITPDFVRDLATRLIGRWVVLWNTYDLDRVDALFLEDEDLHYISSEQAGILQGFEAVRQLHAGFGFVPGGTDRASRLWVENTAVNIYGLTAVVTGRWHFQQADPTTPRQSGTFTMILVPQKRRLAIAHAHFAKDPPAKNVE
jgi:tetratricopeptide (TPR) repeat protein